MAITTVDGLLSALGNSFDDFIIDKSSLSNQIGRMVSLWRASAGLPLPATVPSTAVQLVNGDLGCIPFTNQTLPSKAYLGFTDYSNSTAGNALVLCDRLVNSGGLSFNITTLQTTNLPLNLETLSVSAERIGTSNYSEIQWYLEVYTDSGATASNATVSVVYDDNTTGSLAVVAVGGQLRGGQCVPLNALKPNNGKFIKGISSVQLSAGTGSIGNFGFTAVKELASCSNDISYKRENFDWAKLGLPAIPTNCCLFPMVFPVATSSGIIKSIGKIIYG
jgi:hypothetical protein